MKEGTKNLLTSLAQVEWFNAVGELGENKSIVSVPSWPEAIRRCQSDYWSHVTLEAKNMLTIELASKWMERFREWNKLIREVKLIHEPLIAEKCGKTIMQNSLPEKFVHCVQWDLLIACMEQEYADCVTPGFFKQLAAWYLDGHFPCGWEGSFPDNGRLCVF